MTPIHIRLDPTQPTAQLSAVRMPRIEFRQALFRTEDGNWQQRLRPASLLVTTTALDAQGRKLVVDHQSLRFSLLYNATWPSPVFQRIRNWPYAPVELRRDAPVTAWTVELRLRDLRLAPGEELELVLIG
jgi:hypothetical protein